MERKDIKDIKDIKVKETKTLNSEEAHQLVLNFDYKIKSIYEKLDNQNQAIATLLHDNLEKVDIEKLTSQLTSDELKRLTEATIIMQCQLRKIITEDTLIPFNPKGDYKSDVRIFANNQLINLNLHIEKQRRLLSAYRTQDWQNAIFNDPFVLQTAFSLFANGKLKNTEFETLLIMKYAKTPLASYAKNLSNENYQLNSFTVLDRNGEFTPGACKYLLSNLSGYMTQPFNPAQIENFRQVAWAFFKTYPAENVFFTVESAEYHKDQLAQPFKKSNLGYVLYHNGIEPSEDDLSSNKITKIIFSCVVEDALQLACYPLADIVPVRSIAGDLGISDIEHAVDVGLRPGAVTYPGVPRNPKIHRETDVSDSTRREHDAYHAKLMSKEGMVTRNTLLRIKNLSRAHILKHCVNLKEIAYPNLFSSATWALVDAEFTYFNDEVLDFKRMENQTKRFCIAIDMYPHSTHPPILFTRQGEVTDLGIITFIDMVENVKEWKEHLIDPDDLTERHKEQLEIVKKLFPYFKQDNSKYNIFIFKAYSILGKESLEEIVQLVAQNENILQEFEFKRNNLIKFIGLTCKCNKKILDGSTLSYTLLQFFNGKNKLPENFNFKFHKNIFNTLLLTFIHFKQYPYIRDKVLQPIYQIIVTEGDDKTKYESLKPHIIILKKFYQHHDKPDSPLKAKLPLLKKICDAFDEYLSLHKELQPKGFLIGKKL